MTSMDTVDVKLFYESVQAKFVKSNEVVSFMGDSLTCAMGKKWSKGKVRDNIVLFDKAIYDKLYKEVPSYRLITPSVVPERRGSLARRALQELETKGLIRLVCKHSAQLIYTRATKGKRDAE